MNFIRFEHINLACQDIEVSKKFYQTIFPDWYVRAEGVFNGDRWMHFGNDQFYLTLNNHPEQQRVHQAYESIGINHVGFVIKDGEAMTKLLDAEGIEYYTMTASETKHRIYINDPDGNEIELVEYHPEYALK
ncbi:VOC family protein [Nostocaceae cyanobacterium CENA357]|uniref:VOC family protein n=1 Tax=Atlanticothrix silvestris CENA357 TaxID=1725252 RepID=A0A8J7HJS4_9CYAN|nr:VOC family protein [Atlanticothrix silvestris]MBH8553833.1 VOC family protein [Atlanticothrix silvestris CENA357]